MATFLATTPFLPGPIQNIGSYNFVAAQQFAFEPITVPIYREDPLANLASAYSAAIDPLKGSAPLFIGATETVSLFADGRLAKWIGGLWAPGKSMVPANPPATEAPKEPPKKKAPRSETVIEKCTRLLKEAHELLSDARGFNDGIGRGSAAPDRPAIVYKDKAEQARLLDEEVWNTAVAAIEALKRYRAIDGIKVSDAIDYEMEQWLEPAVKAMVDYIWITAEFGDLDEAVRLMPDLIKMATYQNPLAKTRRGLNQVIVAYSYGDQLSNQIGEAAYGDLYTVGDLLLEAGMAQKAIDMYEQAIEIYARAGNFEAFRKLSIIAGDIHMKIGGYQTAANHYRNAMISFIKTPLVEDAAQHINGLSIVVNIERIGDLAKIVQKLAEAVELMAIHPEIAVALYKVAVNLKAQAEGEIPPNAVKRDGKWVFDPGFPEGFVDTENMLLDGPKTAAK